MAALPFIAIAAQAAGSLVQGMQARQNAQAQQQAEQANAAYDTAAGRTAFMSAADRANQVERQGQEDLGRQAAAIGQAGTGISSASNQDVIRQSETNQRMDFLNTIYGGQVQKYGYDVQAQQSQYAAKVAGLNAQNAMYGGFLGAGTDILTGAAKYGQMKGWYGPTQPTTGAGLSS